MADCDHRDDWGQWLGRWQKDRCGMEAYRCAHCHAVLEPVGDEAALIDGSECAHPAWVDRDGAVRCQTCGIRSDGALNDGYRNSQQEGDSVGS